MILPSPRKWLLRNSVPLYITSTCRRSFLCHSHQTYFPPDNRQECVVFVGIKVELRFFIRIFLASSRDLLCPLSTIAVSLETQPSLDLLGATVQVRIYL